MIVEGDCVSDCWLKVLRILVDEKKSEISPLIVKINNSGNCPSYANELENELNEFLLSVGQPKIETTAGTIFPVSLIGGKKSVFQRYEEIWKYVQKCRSNRRGTYFRRMTAYGDEEKCNQLQIIIDTYNGIAGKRKPVHRRSALIATIFDPKLDHTPQPQLGFPCLQQICILPSGNQMSMNAIYAMQHLSTRAYGNYLGLMRLGNFMAEKLGLEFTHLNCMISILAFGKNASKSWAKDLTKKYESID